MTEEYVKENLGGSIEIRIDPTPEDKAWMDIPEYKVWSEVREALVATPEYKAVKEAEQACNKAAKAWEESYKALEEARVAYIATPQHQAATEAAWELYAVSTRIREKND
jgi:cell fate (sporulation/competence/biofilm development) regulator YlbF (YheA/YmcA/DUF963 family)